MQEQTKLEKFLPIGTIVLLKNGKIDKDENSKKMLENTIEANRGCCRVRKEGAKI